MQRRKSRDSALVKMQNPYFWARFSLLSAPKWGNYSLLFRDPEGIFQTFSKGEIIRKKSFIRGNLVLLPSSLT